MSYYISRGQIASQFVVSAVTGYFYSIACAANAKGVDDSLQVKRACIHGFSMLHKRKRVFLFFLMLFNHGWWSVKLFSSSVSFP